MEETTNLVGSFATVAPESRKKKQSGDIALFLWFCLFCSLTLIVLSPLIRQHCKEVGQTGDRVGK